MNRAADAYEAAVNAAHWTDWLTDAAFGVICALVVYNVAAWMLR